MCHERRPSTRSCARGEGRPFWSRSVGGGGHRKGIKGTKAYRRCNRYPYFLEIDAERRQILRDIANVLVLGAAGQILLPITRSAAVTASLEADELAVGMINL